MCRVIHDGVMKMGSEAKFKFSLNFWATHFFHCFIRFLEFNSATKIAAALIRRFNLPSRLAFMLWMRGCDLCSGQKSSWFGCCPPFAMRLRRKYRPHFEHLESSLRPSMVRKSRNHINASCSGFSGLVPLSCGSKSRKYCAIPLLPTWCRKVKQGYSSFGEGSNFPFSIHESK